jgi:uncharacterized cupin superfamily protein
MTRRGPVIASISIVTLGFGAYIEQRLDFNGANVNVAMFDPRVVELKPAPFRPEWILEGHPKATAAEIDRTHDGSASLIVWRVDAGRFNWYYDFDETITILDGEVYLTDGANAAPGNAAERRLGPGDVVFFHNGSTATWRVPDHVRKIATVKRPLPGPIGTLFRVAKGARRWLLPEAAMADSF